MKTVRITSANSGVGNTFVAVNLAVFLAQQGKNVCLIDLDFDHPNIHNYFNINEDIKTINDYLFNDAPLKECLYNAKTDNNLAGDLWIGNCDLSKKMSILPPKSSMQKLHKILKMKNLIKDSCDILLIDEPKFTITIDHVFSVDYNLIIINPFYSELQNIVSYFDYMTKMVPNIKVIVNKFPRGFIPRRNEFKNLLEKKLRTRSLIIGFINYIEDLNSVEFDNYINGLKNSIAIRDDPKQILADLSIITNSF